MQISRARGEGTLHRAVEGRRNCKREYLHTYLRVGFVDIIATEATRSQEVTCSQESLLTGRVQGLRLK